MHRLSTVSSSLSLVFFSISVGLMFFFFIGASVAPPGTMGAFGYLLSPAVVSMVLAFGFLFLAKWAAREEKAAHRAEE